MRKCDGRIRTRFVSNGSAQLRWWNPSFGKRCWASVSHDDQICRDRHGAIDDGPGRITCCSGKSDVERFRASSFYHSAQLQRLGVSPAPDRQRASAIADAGGRRASDECDSQCRRTRTGASCFLRAAARLIDRFDCDGSPGTWGPWPCAVRFDDAGGRSQRDVPGAHCPSGQSG
jgi:hypothetical protein